MKRRIKYILLLIYAIILNYSAFSQVESNYHNKVLNASGQSMLYPISISINPAQNKTDNNEIGLYISPSLLGIAELNYATFYSIFSISENINTSVSMNGSSSEIFMDLSPAASICYYEERFSISVLGKYSQFSIKDFNNESVFYLDLGGTIKLAEKYYCGFALTNITGSYFKGAENNTQQTAVFGVGTKYNEELAFDINYIIYVNYFGTVSFSTSYKINDYMLSSLSYQGNPGIIELDLNLYLNNWTMPMSISYFDYFGMSYAVGIAVKI